jgi:hypothetical protein
MADQAHSKINGAVDRLTCPEDLPKDLNFIRFGAQPISGSFPV